GLQNLQRLHFLDFFNDPMIIREQRIAAYNGFEGLESYRNDGLWTSWEHCALAVSSKREAIVPSFFNQEGISRCGGAYFTQTTNSSIPIGGSISLEGFLLLVLLLVVIIVMVVIVIVILIVVVVDDVSLILKLSFTGIVDIRNTDQSAQTSNEANCSSFIEVKKAFNLFAGWQLIVWLVFQLLTFPFAEAFFSTQDNGRKNDITSFESLDFLNDLFKIGNSIEGKKGNLILLPNASFKDNVVEEEDGEQIRFLGGNSSSINKEILRIK
ncbi:hypothetical protein Tco_1392360, partial [Tanacetum coccineum]